MGLTDLPNELIERIAQKLHRKRDIANLCLTCKDTHAQATRVLYRSVEFGSSHKDRELIDRLFESKSSSVKAVTFLDVCSRDPCGRTEIDEFVIYLVGKCVPGGLLRLKSLSYIRQRDEYDEYDGYGDRDFMAFGELLRCCEPLTLEHVFFRNDMLHTRSWPSLFHAITSRGTNLRFLEVGGAILAEDLRADDADAVAAVAQELRGLEEVVLPFYLDLSIMTPENGKLGDYGHVILSFVTLPNIRAIRFSTPMIAFFPITAERREWPEDECTDQAEEVMSELASHLTRAAAVHRGKDTNVPLIGFGDASGATAYTELGCVSWNEPLYFQYLGGQKDENDSWTRRWYPQEEENRRDFAIFVPDCERYKR